MNIKSHIGFGLWGLMAAGSLCLAQPSTFTVANAGNWGPIVAPESIAAGFGSNFTTQQYGAVSTPLPTSLGGLRVDISDSNKVTSTAGLYLSSPGQINFFIPSTVMLGRATVAASNAATSFSGTLLVSNIAPALFAANGNGSGAAAAQVLQVSSSGSSFLNNSFGASSSGYGTAPFSISPAAGTYYLILYGTGIRRHSSNPVQASIGGVKVPVIYAGPVSGLSGLDQVNLGPLPQTLANTGKGDVDVVLTVDGVPANTLKINIQ